MPENEGIFEEKYPDADLNTIILFQGDEYIKSAKYEFCWNCGRVTRWYSSSFMYAPLCSERCSTEKWNEYWKALTHGINEEGTVYEPEGD